MKNRMLKALGVLVLALFAYSLAQDTGATVNLAESSEHGQYLVDGEGMALYMFAPDAQGPSTCYDDCAMNWPPFTVDSADAVPTAGEGLDAALFGTVERDDGTFQVTYNGWPLYYYAGDMEAGTFAGQGLGGNWFVIDAMGAPIGMDAGTGEGATDDGGTEQAPATPEEPEGEDDGG